MESHSAHSWKRLTRAIVAVVVVAAVVVGVWWLWPKPLDTSHTKVEISASSKFADAQLDDLVQASYRVNAGMKNCSVDKVKYDERQSEKIVDMEIDADAKGHGSALGRAIGEHGRDGAAVLFVDMTCRDPVDDEDHEEEFMLLPQADGTKAWELQDRGNG
ncbi:hypothetical protein PG2093B_1244 [Bifidobacterium pseudolongum subsp. globosum]|uniref:Uncharacterized protein n=1 Tax=Bifidobacterium pseudolongum subsp. globosum TaxID=1690 RepID=A0A4Q4ZZW6_9BIFI|nr:hypothetical protein [Bifidobacterium pseudolongum]RYQ10150.1 hypothetical protein PG2093B_1244 [Bifidobacterium pseudolongum subsp. globosum]